MRELLFGDIPLADFAGDDAVRAPFKDPTVASLRGVLATPDLESRVYLEAWMGLRQLGEVPSADEDSRLYGVVLDVPVRGGVDTLAGYADGSARYINHAGSVIVYDGDDPTITAIVAALIELSEPLLQIAGVWEGERPPLNRGRARISLLTAQGLHFGEGPAKEFFSAPPTLEPFRAATLLMQKLIELGGPPAAPKKKGFFRR